jgi:hypothetical protein
MRSSKLPVGAPYVDRRCMLDNLDCSCTAFYAMLITVIFHIYLITKFWIIFEADVPFFIYQLLPAVTSSRV